MNWIIYPLIALTTFFIMEGITWLTHKYVMHGFLWFLHKDHHQPEKGFFEKNDFFFVIFAIPGWLMHYAWLEQRKTGGCKHWSRHYIVWACLFYCT